MNSGRNAETGPLPTPSLTVFRRIVTACDRFENAWRAGRRPSIDLFLQGIPEPEQTTLRRELLALERELQESVPATPPAPRLVPSTPRQEPVPHVGSCVPATIGKYLILSSLGQGGQGHVYRVVHPGLGRELVLKIALAPIGNDTRLREQLFAEGWLLAELNHPNLVRIFDLDFDNGRPFLVMEFVEGVHLERHRRDVCPTLRQAVALVAELSRVVAYVHRHGVIHHDIKPKNILIDLTGRPRLIDFGLAQLRPAWGGGASGGTPSYMAPEQARMELNLGPRTDVFSLGAVLYFLVTGRAPFEGRTREETWQRAANGTIDLGPLRAANLPARLENVCLRALESDPSARYQTADELASELHGYLHPTSSVSSRSTRPLPPGRPSPPLGSNSRTDGHSDRSRSSS